ncbi:ribokinase [Amycolatopsis jejuensis]|uniref:ribokinase n=1 Tax=Amycolatopsis jejuensis TaxID=330084 RepID=UPI0005241257|nr:ribokinase [Amycolatopsis jejuensis]
MTGVVVAGSVNVDRVVLVQAHPRPGETVLGHGLRVSPGGKGANQAVAAARAGARVHLLGRVGADAELSGLRRHGVDVTHTLATAGVPTGTAHITVDEAGENSIIVHPGANAAVQPSDMDKAAAVIESAVVLLVQLEIPLDAAVRAAEIAAAAGVRVVLNASPAGAVPERLLDLADPVIVNEHELAALGPCAACVTLGPAGARWGAHTARPPKVEVVDTTGAGDSFAGALAAALAAGCGDAEALQAAVDAGARACTWHGAQPPEPKGNA